MDQIHRRFTAEQIRVLQLGYCQGTLCRSEVEEMLHLGKTRFFALLREFRRAPDRFTIDYHRRTPARLSSEAEESIRAELLREKGLVEDPQLPISDYNYSALRDRLSQHGITVSTTTITTRAKALGCYRPHRKSQVHDRQVLTAAIGALVQHDASVHLWSPYAAEKWTLITSIDDYSRKLLFADFFPHETAWAHIQAAQTLMQTYGLPLRYYVDNLRVFRFVQKRDSFWRNHVLTTDDVDPQWRQVMRTLGVDVIYALSPQAKGKVERTFRWMQDRIVRQSALDHLSTIDEVRAVLRYEVDRYNNHQVHATTGQIPSLRFDQARTSGCTLFRPLALPKPYREAKDVFCLHETRVVNGYRRISLFNHDIEVPNVPLREEVDVHIIPNTDTDTMEIRIWWAGKVAHSAVYPLRALPNS